MRPGRHPKVSEVNVLQLAYISTATPAVNEIEVRRILEQSQRNNARDGVTGLLYFGGRRFLQVIEGPATAVEAAIARIQRDPRHHAIVTLSRREIDAREFGNWSMATTALAAIPPEVMLERVRALVAHASANVRAQFESFVALRPAA